MPLKRLVCCLDDLIVASEAKNLKKTTKLVQAAFEISSEIKPDPKPIESDITLISKMLNEGKIQDAILKTKELKDSTQNAIDLGEELLNKMLALKKSGEDPIKTSNSMSPFQLAIGSLCFQNWMMQEPGEPGSRLNMGMIRALESGLKGESIDNLETLEASLETYEIDFHMPFPIVFDLNNSNTTLLKTLIRESKEAHNQFETSANRKLSKKLSIAWLILEKYSQKADLNIPALIENSLFFEAMVALSFETGLRCHFESPKLAIQMGNEPLAL